MIFEIIILDVTSDNSQHWSADHYIYIMNY